MIHDRTIYLNGRRSNLSIEDCFWRALLRIAAARNVKPGQLLSEIEARAGARKLSHAVRQYVFEIEHRRRQDAEARLVFITSDSVRRGETIMADAPACPIPTPQANSPTGRRASLSDTDATRCEIRHPGRYPARPGTSIAPGGREMLVEG